MTLDEYLARPEGSDKLEWVNGQAYGMAGGSPRHNVAAVNVSSLLRAGLASSPCIAASSDQRVRVDETDSYVYPDVVVVCPPWRVAADDPNSVTNPTVLVEVLSPSTKNYELGAKLGHYRRMPSVQHVLFVDPDDRTVILVSRNGDSWSLHDYTEGTLALAAVDLTLSIDDIFADLDGLPG